MPPVLSPDDFRSLTEPLTLQVKVDDTVATLALAVESVRPLPPHRLRELPFSLMLLGPRTPLLPQATYAMRHPRLGMMEIFIVPVAQDANSARYEATFN